MPKRLIPLIAVVLLFATSAYAAPIYVDADASGPTYNGTSWKTAYKTIEQAVSSNASYETWIKKGVYHERITLKKYSRVYGGFMGCETATDQRIPNAFPTVIDANGISRGIDTIASSFVTIDSISVKNGVADYGGGIRIAEGCTAKVRNCRVFDCKATSGGGGVYFGDYAMGEMSDCFIARCKAPIGGGAIVEYHSYPTLSRNVIVRNHAYEHGGGVYCPFHSGAALNNCTLSYNSASIDGGGIYTYYGGPVQLNNCIVTNNSAPTGAGIYCGGYSSQTTVSNCNFFDNTSGDFGGVISEPTPPFVILHLNPSFIAPSRDVFHLFADSPCPTMGAFPVGAAYQLDRIGLSRLLPDGACVEFKGKIVGFVDGEVTYIQEPDRCAGIACRGLVGLTRGDIISYVEGSLSTETNGRRVLTPRIYNHWPYGQYPMKPLGIPICHLSDNSGVYVRAWGKVESIQIDGFTLRDGQSFINVRFPGQTPHVGSTISITGVYTLTSDFSADSLIVF